MHIHELRLSVSQSGKRDYSVVNWMRLYPDAYIAYGHCESFMNEKFFKYGARCSQVKIPRLRDIRCNWNERTATSGLLSRLVYVCRCATNDRPINSAHIATQLINARKEKWNQRKNYYIRQGLSRCVCVVAANASAPCILLRCVGVPIWVFIDSISIVIYLFWFLYRSAHCSWLLRNF